MDKKDFQKGQIVYLKYIGDRRYGTLDSIIEATVKSIGSKYITVIENNRNVERKFEIDNDFREYNNGYSAEYQLYINKKQIEEEIEAKEIGKLIKSQFENSWSNETKLSIEKLRKIKEIILS